MDFLLELAPRESVYALKRVMIYGTFLSLVGVAIGFTTLQQASAPFGYAFGHYPQFSFEWFLSLIPLQLYHQFGSNVPNCVQEVRKLSTFTQQSIPRIPITHFSSTITDTLPTDSIFDSIPTPMIFNPHFKEQFISTIQSPICKNVQFELHPGFTYYLPFLERIFKPQSETVDFFIEIEHPPNTILPHRAIVSQPSKTTKSHESTTTTTEVNIDDDNNNVIEVRVVTRKVPLYGKGLAYLEFFHAYQNQSTVALNELDDNNEIISTNEVLVTSIPSLRIAPMSSLDWVFLILMFSRYLITITLFPCRVLLLSIYPSLSLNDQELHVYLDWLKTHWISRLETFIASWIKPVFFGHLLALFSSTFIPSWAPLWYGVVLNVLINLGGIAISHKYLGHILLRLQGLDEDVDFSFASNDGPSRTDQLNSIIQINNHQQLFIYQFYHQQLERLIIQTNHILKHYPNQQTGPLIAMLTFKQQLTREYKRRQQQQQQLQQQQQQQENQGNNNENINDEQDLNSYPIDDEITLPKLNDYIQLLPQHFPNGILSIPTIVLQKIVSIIPPIEKSINIPQLFLTHPPTLPNTSIFPSSLPSVITSLPTAIGVLYASGKTTESMSMTHYIRNKPNYTTRLETKLLQQHQNAYDQMKKMHTICSDPNSNLHHKLSQFDHDQLELLSSKDYHLFMPISDTKSTTQSTTTTTTATTTTTSTTSTTKDSTFADIDAGKSVLNNVTELSSQYLAWISEFERINGHFQIPSLTTIFSSPTIPSTIPESIQKQYLQSITNNNTKAKPKEQFFFNDFHQFITKIHNSTECSICMLEFESDPIWVLGCRHKFHANCFQKWLQGHSKTKCPVCAKSICSSFETVDDGLFFARVAPIVTVFMFQSSHREFTKYWDESKLFISIQHLQQIQELKTQRDLLAVENIWFRSKFTATQREENLKQIDIIDRSISELVNNTNVQKPQNNDDDIDDDEEEEKVLNEDFYFQLLRLDLWELIERLTPKLQPSSVQFDTSSPASFESSNLTDRQSDNNNNDSDANETDDDSEDNDSNSDQELSELVQRSTTNQNRE